MQKQLNTYTSATPREENMLMIHKLINKCEVQRKDIRIKRSQIDFRKRNNSKAMNQLCRKVDENLRSNMYDIYTGFYEEPPQKKMWKSNGSQL